MLVVRRRRALGALALHSKTTASPNARSERANSLTCARARLGVGVGIGVRARTDLLDVVELLADGGEQLAEGLDALLVVVVLRPDQPALTPLHLDQTPTQVCQGWGQKRVGIGWSSGSALWLRTFSKEPQQLEDGLVHGSVLLDPTLC